MPPDANTLLSVAEHCLRSRNYVNVIVAGKQPGPQWLGMDAAVRHCAAGAGLWDWASNDGGAAPDVVMACAGDVPTLETLAAVDLLRRHAPEMKVRMVNAVDLMALQPPYEWIAGQLPPRLAAGRTVAVHLGSGASLCALQAGASIETTMGMTRLDGLMMGTRCGSLDPGVVLYLMQARGMGVAMWSTCFTTNPGCWAWPA